jgi:hypothetical protein
MKIVRSITARCASALLFLCSGLLHTANAQQRRCPARTRAHPRRAGDKEACVKLVVSQTYVRRRPTAHAARAGVVTRGARFKIKRRLVGSGCRGDWIELAVGGYLCSDETRTVFGKPGGPRHPTLAPGRRLPFRYVLTGRNGSAEYANWEDAACDLPFRFLDPGFGRTVTTLVRKEGLRFWKTRRNTYIPAEDVFRVYGAKFAGARLNKNRLPLVFTHRRARLYRRPAVASRRRLKKFHYFSVLKTVRDRKKRRYYALRQGGFVRARAVRLAAPHPPPAEVKGRTKWLDLDLAQQTLVAYEGRVPVYATLMSSGRRGKTPTGTFRVWAKIAATTMDNDPQAHRRYSMWDVPWTLYFKGGLAVHGTYWHRRFGFKRSHGCINLSPRDARWIFDWSDPVLPPGWWARLPGKNANSLVVHIRKSSPASRKAVFRPHRSLGVQRPAWSWLKALTIKP